METPDQLAGARAAGCAYGQGNLIAAPLPGDRVTDWLIGHQPPPGKTHTG